MSIVEKSALIQVPAAFLFKVVNDVDSYPEFLPWCKDAKLLSKNETELCGEIVVSKAGVTQSFSTCNRLFPYHRIEIKLKEGPFRKLEGAWEFTPLNEQACKVELMLEFDFSNVLMRGAFGVIFGQIANAMVDSFCARANQLADNK